MQQSDQLHKEKNVFQSLNECFVLTGSSAADRTFNCNGFKNASALVMAKQTMLSGCPSCCCERGISGMLWGNLF